jgi:hypothetical protein
MYLGSAIAMVFVASCLYGTLWIMDYLNSEKVILYSVDAPNPPGNGRVLDIPSIKVTSHMTGTALVLIFSRLLALQPFNVTLRQQENFLVL